MDTVFKEALIKATEAGNAAGEEWLNERLAGTRFYYINGQIVNNRGERENPVLDSCGGAYIELKDKRTKFAKYLKRESHQQQLWSVPIAHKFGGWQDMGLKEAVMYAAYKVLTKQYGLTGLSYVSYID